MTNSFSTHGVLFGRFLGSGVPTNIHLKYLPRVAFFSFQFRESAPVFIVQHPAPMMNKLWPGDPLALIVSTSA